jgi:PAS domain S-box-containing protein
MSDQHVVWVGRDISERKQAQAQIQLQAAALASTANAIMIADPGGKIEWVNPAFTTLTGYSLQEAVGHTSRILKSGEQDSQFYQQLWETILSGRVWRGELVNKRKDGSLYYEEQTISPVRDAEGNILKFIGIKQDITSRKQTEARLLTLLQRQTQIAAFGRELADTRELPTLFRTSQRTLKQMTDFDFFAVVLMDPENHVLKVAYANLDGVELDVDPHLTLKLRDPAAICARAIQERKPVITENATDIRKALAAMRVPLTQDIRSACCLPMLANDQVIGLIELQSLKENAYLSEDLEWLSTIANQIGLNIQHAMYFAEIQQKVDELSTLTIIDSAVIAHLEPENTFDLILKQVTAGLKVDAAALLLFDPKSQMLDCVAEVGYQTAEILQMRLQLGESLAGQAALDRQIIHKDLEDREHEPFLKEEFIPQDFLDYYGIPLIADSKLIGVLEILHRSLLTPNANWLHFLEIVATRAAVAINTIQLYDDIQDSHEELLEAYELTIEGWSKAMDLRDKETENHTRRVTEMTLRLAERFDIHEEQLVHIRRGALLHDIGKLGVPDQILLKPGALTAEEWKIMRRHPELAYEMLDPIEYLRPALDIPYCHHEDWDGQGYPRGLKGEEIPLAARIFAAVDVFDALTSDRPYREAWSVQKALAYIREQAGKRFDPRIVDVFMEMHGAKETPHD